ncbi:tRNA (adenosine(37)-N6)-threonylcarbamoyltransferase complex dimerization subunit type 1 TsaB [Paucilactobacillus sp. N302-9]
MKILALDTSNKPLSVALLEDTKLVAQTTLKVAKNHSSYLMPVVENLLAVADWQPEDLQRIVVADGPGSYTGIRIAVTTAKTLAATLNIELVGISSLELVAQNILTVSPEKNAIAFFDARRQNAFVGGYQINQGSTVNYLPDQHISISHLIEQIKQYAQPVVVVGTITDEFKTLAASEPLIQIGSPSAAVPQAGILGMLGISRQPITDVDAFIPRYLRVTEAEAVWQKSHPGEINQTYVREV